MTHGRIEYTLLPIQTSAGHSHNKILTSGLSCHHPAKDIAQLSGLAYKIFWAKVMVVITTGQTLDIEYDVKVLFSEWAIHRFLYKASSLKTMQVELFLDESCLNSCELLMIKRKTNFASYCFKEHESWS